MEDLVKELKILRRTNLRKVIDQRKKYFQREKDLDTLFKELCFCILTANFDAARSIRIMHLIGDDVLRDSKEALSRKLKEYGHRFPNKRAEYIVLARNKKHLLKRVFSMDPIMAREFIVENFKGIGMKEASHFLRNIGFDLSIIDFHIIDLLERYGVIKKPKYLGKKEYLFIEEKLREISKKTGIPLGELDLYLWFMETGKVLK